MPFAISVSSAANHRVATARKPKSWPGDMLSGSLFCKTEYVHRSSTPLVNNQHPVAAGAAFAVARHSLPDQPAAETGIDQATLRAGNSLHQTGVRDAFAAGEANQPAGFEDTHDVTGLAVCSVL